MKEKLTWKTFLLLQPLILFDAYLVGCFFDATIRILPYGPKDFPINGGLLIFILPSTLFIALIAYLLTRNCLSVGGVTTLLFLLVPLGAGITVQMIFFLISSIVRIQPAG